MLMACESSSRAELDIPADWLRNGKARLSMWACCCPLGHRYLDEMASISGISTDVCAYLPFGHD